LNSLIQKSSNIKVMVFTNLKLENFRDIKFLQIDKIKQVNLITGKNNCGKTSILEAIFLLVGMSNPQLALKIHHFRNLSLSADEELSYLFNHLDFSKLPKISGKSNLQERSLKIKPVYKTSTNNHQQISEKLDLNRDNFIGSASSTSEDYTKVEGIEFDFFDGEKEYQSSIKLEQGELLIPHNYRENISATFLSPSTLMPSLSQELEKAIINKKLHGIIESLKEIEPRLFDIRMGDRGVVYADIGFDTLVPINIMGDGIIRILTILASISKNQNGILIIDEIENGFHYSAVSVLWKALFRMASENNVQLFIVTHSYECIESFVNVHQTMKSELGEDFVSLFRIEKNAKGEHKAFQYEADILLVGVEEQFEVR